MNLTVPDTLIDRATLEARVREMAREIAPHIGQDWTVVVLLQGAFLFAADLVRGLAEEGLTPRTDFLWLSSYGAGRVSTGRVQVRADLSESIDGRGALLLDDVYDTGRTLAFAADHLRGQGATAVRTAVLASKPAAAIGPPPDHVGFALPDRFLIGYGMDDAGFGRGVPFIGALR